ncbi:unnamed protein product [Agarophyton chilense]
MKVRLEFDVNPAEEARVKPLLHAFIDLVDALNAIDLSTLQANRTDHPDHTDLTDHADLTEHSDGTEFTDCNDCTASPASPADANASAHFSTETHSTPDSKASVRLRRHKFQPGRRPKSKRRAPPLDSCEAVFDAVGQMRIPVKHAASILQRMMWRSDAPVRDEDIVCAATSELIDPAKVCNHPSRASNIVLTVAAVNDSVLKGFCPRFMAEAAEKLRQPRHTRCNRAQFLGYSEGLAAMVNTHIVSADTALELVHSLLQSGKSSTAAVTTLCRVAEACEQTLDTLVKNPQILKAVKDLLTNVASIPDYSYDIQYLNGATGWDIPLSSAESAKHV